MPLDECEGNSSCSRHRVGREERSVTDMKEGRMGCQAVAMQLPAADMPFPLCTKRCVVVVGGENGDEDFESETNTVRQFSSVLVYDAEDGQWRPEDAFPAIPTPRTAMAL